ncbi:MAG: PilZ domain-containing protein [Bdellovibrionota bacterium]
MSSYKIRQFTRFRTKVNVMIRSVGRFSWSRGVMLNLSQGGLLLQSDEPFPIASEVEIEFNTVDAKGKNNRRRLRGEILWRRGTRHGLKFVTRAARTSKK